MGAGSPSSCAGCTCPGHQSIPGRSQPCPFWTLSRDPLVSPEVGCGRPGGKGWHSLTSSSTRLPGQQEGAGEERRTWRAQDCSMSAGLLGPPCHLNIPSMSHRRGQCRPAGRGTRLWAHHQGTAFKLKRCSSTELENKFLSPPRPRPSLSSLSTVTLERGFSATSFSLSD